MNRKALTRSLTGTGVMVASLMGASPVAMAEADFSLGLEAGISSDSNVGVEGVGQAGESDTSYHFGLDADVNFDLSEDVSFSLGYDYSSDQYANYDMFSQQAHSASAGIKARIDDLTLGLTYTYIATLLDGDDFMDMQVISPSISSFVSDTVYLRAAYSRYEKEFDFLSTRDASSDIVTVDAFIFFDGYRSFLDLRASLEQEDANAARFDYEGYALGASLDLAIDGFGRENTLELGISYRDRDYQSITPSIGTTRQDEKLELEVALEVPLSDMVHIRGGYKHVDRSSNLPIADYNEQIVSLMLGVEF